MTFETDLEALFCADIAGLVAVEMRLRHSRSWLDPGSSLVQMATGRRENSSLKLMLYPLNAAARCRPTVEFYADPMIDIEAVAEQGSRCLVAGWPSVGRAVRVTVSNVELFSLTPCRVPAFGKRFGRSDSAPRAPGSLH